MSRLTAEIRNGRTLLAGVGGEWVGIEDFTLYPAKKPQASDEHGWKAVQQEFDAFARMQKRQADRAARKRR
jgi:hypothetical protein